MDFSLSARGKVDVMPSLLNRQRRIQTVEVRDPDEPLLYVLRNSPSLTGAKSGFLARPRPAERTADRDCW
jgi:hypothetical protein